MSISSYAQHAHSDYVRVEAGVPLFIYLSSLIHSLNTDTHFPVMGPLRNTPRLILSLSWELGDP